MKLKRFQVKLTEDEMNLLESHMLYARCNNKADYIRFIISNPPQHVGKDINLINSNLKGIQQVIQNIQDRIMDFHKDFTKFYRVSFVLQAKLLSYFIEKPQNKDAFKKAMKEFELVRDDVRKKLEN